MDEVHGMSVTTIVVPCYNEARRLPVAAFQAFFRQCDDVAFCFVNDGSADGTLSVLNALQDSAPDRCQVLNLTRNQGKAEAVRRGCLQAIEAGASYVGYWDADLATPLDEIATFQAVLDRRAELLLVMGARVRMLGRSIERRPVRHLLGRVFATAASQTLGMGVYDTQCGAKLFRASPMVRALFRDPFCTRWIFDVELLARLVRLAGREISRAVYEQPLRQWHDVAGSKVRPRDFFKAFFELARIRRRYFHRNAHWPAAAPTGAHGVPAPKVRERFDREKSEPRT